MQFSPGAKCKVNGRGDLGIDSNARRFIGQTCTIIRRTKSGLIQVHLSDDEKATLSVPQSNIDFLPPNTGNKPPCEAGSA